jgi:hypothetical protein
MIQWFVRATCPRRADSPVALPEGVSVRKSAWLPTLAGWILGGGRPVAAVTLARTIVFHPSAPVTERIVRHELAHVRQWERQPLTFFARYAIECLRHGYTNNPYEVEARAAEAGPRD